MPPVYNASFRNRHLSSEEHEEGEIEVARLVYEYGGRFECIFEEVVENCLNCLSWYKQQRVYSYTANKFCSKLSGIKFEYIS